MALAGCSSTPTYEAPPEVIDQPPVVTTDEAVAEAKEVQAQDKAENQAEEAAEAQAADAQAAPQAPAAPEGQATVASPPLSPAAPPIATALAGQSSTVGPKPAQASPERRFRPSTQSTQEIRDQYEKSGTPLDFEQWLDHTHDLIYTWGQQLVEATDHKFADKEKEMLPVPASPFRLATMVETVSHSDGLHAEIDIDMDISLKLPNIEERLNIFVTSTEIDESPSMSGNDVPALRAGLRYEFKHDLDFDIGVRVDWPPVLFTSLKWSREYEMSEKWTFYPLVKLFAETKESVGYASAATFDRWSGRTLLRSSTYTKWRADRGTNEWSQTFVLARASQLIVPDRYGSYIAANDIGVGWGLRAFGKDEGTFEGERATEYYEVGVFYRRPTRNKWLYLHFEPIVRWDKAYSWATDLGVRLGFDILFWDLARQAR
jgi:hypothetical protein